MQRCLNRGLLLLLLLNPVLVTDAVAQSQAEQIQRHEDALERLQEQVQRMQQQVDTLVQRIATLQTAVLDREPPLPPLPPPPPRGIPASECCGEVGPLGVRVGQLERARDLDVDELEQLSADVQRLLRERDALADALETRLAELERWQAELRRTGQEVVLDGNSGGGRVAVLNREGKVAVELYAFNSGAGAADVKNGAGQRAVRLTSDAEGHGEARFSNAAGKDMVYLSGKGQIVLNDRAVGDHAEIFELASRDGVAAGTVLAVTAEGGRLAPTSGAYDPRVVGVVSGAGDLGPGLIVGGRADGTVDLPVALSGQVYVRVCDENGPIRPGDLLVSASRPGLAMKATDSERAFGAVLGKALESFDPAADAAGEGLVRMLVMVR